MKEEIVAARLAKRHSDRSERELTAILTDRTSNKYPAPLDSYSKPTCTAHTAIMQLMRQ
jgi:hypothetical protein